MRRFLNRLEGDARAGPAAQPGAAARGRPRRRSRPAAAANREAIVAMERYCEGDASAFRALYVIVAPRLFTFVRCLVRDHALAEELLQQTFLKLHQARATYVAGADPLPWLYAIAHRTCLDELRRGLRAPITVTGELGELPARFDGGSETSRPTYGEHTVDAVLCALERLPETLRSAVVLTKIEGNSIEETAAILGATPAAVKLRAHRGYVKLRELLRELGAG
jgi:RNA polymerase sigma-70 factor (ECF subfamily)